MKLLQYYALFLVFCCQQSYCAGRVILKNNSGEAITIELTTPVDRGEYHDKQILPPGSVITNWQHGNFTGTGMEAAYNISGIRVSYSSSSASGLAGWVRPAAVPRPVNIEKIKTAIKNCPNKDVILEIQPEHEAPVGISCS